MCVRSAGSIHQSIDPSIDRGSMLASLGTSDLCILRFPLTCLEQMKNKECMHNMALGRPEDFILIGLTARRISLKATLTVLCLEQWPPEAPPSLPRGLYFSFSFPPSPPPHPHPCSSSRPGFTAWRELGKPCQVYKLRAPERSKNSDKVLAMVLQFRRKTLAAHQQMEGDGRYTSRLVVGIDIPRSCE